LETEVLWLLGDKRIEDLGVLVKKSRYGGRHTLPYRVLRPCTLGFAARAVIKSFCNGEPAAVKSIFGRFLLHVYPGETLSTEMWLDGQK